MSLIKTAALNEQSFVPVDWSELKCDWPECDNDLVVFGPERRTIRARARREGWRTTKAQDYCAAHAEGMLAS